MSSPSSCSIEGKPEDLALGPSQTSTHCAWSQVDVLWWPYWCVILSIQTDLSGSPSRLWCDLGGPSAAASTLVRHSPAVIYPYTLLDYSVCSSGACDGPSSSSPNSGSLSSCSPRSGQQDLPVYGRFQKDCRMIIPQRRLTSCATPPLTPRSARQRTEFTLPLSLLSAPVGTHDT
jgi:hypothetical protein